MDYLQFSSVFRLAAVACLLPLACQLSCSKPVVLIEPVNFDCGKHGSIVVRAAEKDSSQTGYFEHSFTVLDEEGKELGHETTVEYGQEDLSDIYAVFGNDSVYVLFRTLPSHEVFRIPEKESSESWVTVVLEERALLMTNFQSREVVAPARSSRVLVSELNQLSKLCQEQLSPERKAKIVKGIFRIFLGTTFDAKSLVKLKELPSLGVIVSERAFNAEEVKQLSQLTNIGHIYLTSADMEDQDVQRLQTLTNTKGICLPMQGPSYESVRQLKNALPNSTIHQAYPD